MTNPNPYENLSGKELQNLLVNDDRQWRPALDELFRRCRGLVKRRAEFWGVEQMQLASRCLIIAGVRRASLEGKRFETWLSDILDGVASAWDSGSGFGSRVLACSANGE